MQTNQLTIPIIKDYQQYLYQEEKSVGTIDKHLRDIYAFYRWLNRRAVDKFLAAQWKDSLLQRGYAPVTINSMLSAVNGLFAFLGWNQYRVRFLRIQRRIFRDPKRELTRQEYDRMLTAAKQQGKERLALLMETICNTGIRVSEVQYITVEAAKSGRAEITLKGKIRIILLSTKLCRRLLQYAQKQKIAFGAIFCTKSGRCISRRQIWAEMKSICAAARVNPQKIFPHNLRHLFATVFFKACKNIVQLADILGHSSIETTRIYLLTSGIEHQRQLDKLGLVH